MNNITKKEFKNILKEIIELQKKRDAVAYGLSEISDSFIFFGKGLDIEIKLLEKIMKDEKTQWISYWYFDLNQGKEYKKGKITDKKGKNIKLETLSDLYNLLNNE